MPNYRRIFQPGGTYFFTLVTFNRKPFLTQHKSREILRDVIQECQSRYPFKQDAFVLLPEHYHCVWSLPPQDAEYPKRLGWIKKEFTKRWRQQRGFESIVSLSKTNDRRAGVWQPKYWEHTIRDQEDFNNHIEYTHYNPVKHGHVECPSQWEWSSFHRFVQEGIIANDWCCRRSAGSLKTDKHLTYLKSTGE